MPAAQDNAAIVGRWRSSPFLYSPDLKRDREIHERKFSRKFTTQNRY
jgi:hypothetical protein